LHVNEQLRRLVATASSSAAREEAGSAATAASAGSSRAAGALTDAEWGDLVQRLVAVAVEGEGAMSAAMARLLRAAAAVATAVVEGLDGRPVGGGSHGSLDGGERGILMACPWAAAALAPLSRAAGLLQRLHGAGVTDLSPLQVAALQDAAGGRRHHAALALDAAGVPVAALVEGAQAGAAALTQLRARVAEHAATTAGAACAGQ
jgi:hypothetical protein